MFLFRVDFCNCHNKYSNYISKQQNLFNNKINTLHMFNQAFHHETSNATLENNRTAVNIGDNDATIVVPAGYNPNDIIIVKNEAPDLPLPAKPEPRTVADLLDDDSLQASAQLKFIRKVYIIVEILLAVTVGFCFLSYYVKGFYQFQLEQYWALYTFLGIGVACAVAIILCGNERVSDMSTALKIMLLIIVNLCTSYVISFITSYYASKYGAPFVLECMILTSGLVFALTLYSFMVKVDFSTCVAIIIVVLFCFILFGLSFAMNLGTPTLHNLYGTFGVIFGGIILVLDTQYVASGQRDCSLDDPIMGALIIYIDIIRIFLYMLMALKKK